MSIKNTLRDRIQRADRRQREEDTAHRGSLLNRSYHKYFEGYTEYTVKKDNGKNKIVRIYTGVYYTQHLDTARYLLVRLLYILLTALSFFLFFSGSMADVSYNYVWYVTLFQAFSIPCLFMLLILLIGYVFADRKMVIHNYNLYHKQLMNVAKYGSLFFAFAAAGMVINLLITQTFSAAVLYPVAKFLIAALALLGIFQVESRITYDTLENSNPKTVPGGIEISNVSKRRK
ncbi:MAG: hypothetical protein LIP11_11420 [Clostridiales bacterium]|nr:hypothetical protein [Clostridiales bacterium]